MMNNHIDKLKETADKLGIKYSPNIGGHSLQKKIDAYEDLEAEKMALTTVPKSQVAKAVPKERKVSDKDLKVMMAKNLIKVKVVNMDPQNRAATTAFSGVCNMVMDIQKVIPLNKVIALEECLCRELEDRRYGSSEPEIGRDGEPTGNFISTSAPVYQVIRYQV